jgi:uncharacterized protein
MTGGALSHLRLGAFGFGLGATVSAVGFSDYGELHRMFTFADLRLFLAFGGAVVLAAAAFAIHCGRGRIPSRPITRGTVAGAVLFGVGWALCGGCPGAVLVQIGEGKLAALVTLGGILAGTAVGHRVKARLGWDSGSCGG